MRPPPGRPCPGRALTARVWVILRGDRLGGGDGEAVASVRAAASGGMPPARASAVLDWLGPGPWLISGRPGGARRFLGLVWRWEVPAGAGIVETFFCTEANFAGRVKIFRGNRSFRGNAPGGRGAGRVPPRGTPGASRPSLINGPGRRNLLLSLPDGLAASGQPPGPSACCRRGSPVPDHPGLRRPAGWRLTGWRLTGHRWSFAHRAADVRSVTPMRRKMLPVCTLTVDSAMPRRRAICLFARPVATRRRTCFSRSLS